MTHPTYHDALRAALVDLRERLATGWRAVAVSGPHAYTDGPARRLVTVRLDADVLGVDDSGAHEQVEFTPVCAEQRATPGYPIDEEEALLATWYDGAAE